MCGSAHPELVGPAPSGEAVKAHPQHPPAERSPLVLALLRAVYQVATVLDSTYGLRMPEDYYRWMRIVSWIGAIDWLGLALPSACFLSTKAKLIVVAVGPVILVLAAILFGSCYRWAQGRQRRSATSADEPYRTRIVRAAVDGALTSLPFALVVVFFFVAGVSTQIFQARACIGYVVEDATQARRFFLREDLSIECYTSKEHEGLVNLMWVFVFVWPVGVILLYSLVLVPCRDPILAGESTAFTRATFFLTNDYHPHVYFWEIVELLRRTLLTGWVLLFDEQSRYTRLLMALLVSIVSFALQLSIRPYKRP